MRTRAGTDTAKPSQSSDGAPAGSVRISTTLPLRICTDIGASRPLTTAPMQRSPVPGPSA